MATQLQETQVGKIRIEPSIYHFQHQGGLKEVLELVCKDSLHNRITEGDMELKQALEFVREQTDRVLKAMVGVDV